MPLLLKSLALPCRVKVVLFQCAHLPLPFLGVFLATLPDRE
jgi:hypothetical protein